MANLLDEIDFSADRRVRKTKRSLRQSLFKLIEEKNINQITVTELTDLADVNRSTFYLYYSDVPDMMEKIQNEIYDIVTRTAINKVSEFNCAEDFYTYIVGILKLCKENYEIFRFVTRNECNNGLAQRIQLSVRNVVPDSEKGFSCDDPRYYLTTFALSGAVAVILEWINDGIRISCEDLAKFLASTYCFGSTRQKNSDDYKQYDFYKNKK